jgi:hypothetical protein
MQVQVALAAAFVRIAAIICYGLLNDISQLV